MRNCRESQTTLFKYQFNSQLNATQLNSKKIKITISKIIFFLSNLFKREENRHATKFKQISSSNLIKTEKELTYNIFTNFQPHQWTTPQKNIKPPTNNFEQIIVLQYKLTPQKSTPYTHNNKKYKKNRVDHWRKSTFLLNWKFKRYN